MTDEIIDRITVGTGSLRFRVGGEVGCVFEEDDDFDGITLTIEVRSVAEGRYLATLLERALARHGNIGR